MKWLIYAASCGSARGNACGTAVDSTRDDSGDIEVAMENDEAAAIWPPRVSGISCVRQKVDDRKLASLSKASAGIHPVEVVLHIYDIMDTSFVRQANWIFRQFGTGIFHVGIEVLGREWSYGYASSGTGVYHCVPKASDGYGYRESVTLGSTDLTPEQVQRVLIKLEKSWAAAEYDVLKHNCCHFCCVLGKELGVSQLPDWVCQFCEANKPDNTA